MAFFRTGGGTDTSDANATAADILLSKTAYVDDEKITGTMPNNGDVSHTIGAGEVYNVPAGYTSGGVITAIAAGATITVSYSSDFYGATITATNGSVTLTKTATSTGSVDISVPEGGVWTISAPAQGQTFSTTATVVLEYTAQLSAIPDGSTVTPINDIQIWLHCGNIWDKNYTTISQVLADTTTLLTLISSNNAADYMARSTSWANSVTANSTAMTYIGNNDYCASTLLANSTWRTAITDSTYFESVVNKKVPTMTSNTAPSGEAFGENLWQSGYEAYKAFNNGSGRAIMQKSDGHPSLGYKFTTSIELVKVYVQEATNNGWESGYTKIQGSNDGTTWNDLGEFTAPLNSGGNYTTTVKIAHANKFSRFRLYVQSGNNSNILDVATLQFYGR